jgi:hypothetical protein
MDNDDLDTLDKETKALRSGVSRQFKKLISTFEDWLESEDNGDGEEIYEELLGLYERLTESLEN